MDLSVTLTGVVLSVLTLFVLLGTSVSLTMLLAVRWTNRMRNLQTETLESQLRHLRLQNLDLTNKLLSADAMTYSTLATLTNSSDSSLVGVDHYGLVPSGTDQAELARYEQTYGEQLDDQSDIDEYLVS